ncbi:hypothetical protein ACP70R_044374 [Stipagrostis hirtigluma subsp. patula]
MDYSENAKQPKELETTEVKLRDDVEIQIDSLDYQTPHTKVSLDDKLQDPKPIEDILYDYNLETITNLPQDDGAIQVDSSLDVKEPGDYEIIDDLPQDYVCTIRDHLAIHLIKTSPENKILVDINDVMNAYTCCMRAQAHMQNRAEWNAYLEDTFVSGILKRDSKIKFTKEDVKTDTFVQRTKNCLKYSMVLDSLCWSFHCKDLALTLQGLEKHFNILQELDNSICHEWKDLKVTTWTIKEVLPRAIQKDSSASCDLFVLKFIEFWTGDELSRSITQLFFVCNANLRLHASFSLATTPDSYTSTQKAMAKFRLKLAAKLIHWKTNVAKRATKSEPTQDTESFSEELEILESLRGEDESTDIRPAKWSKTSYLSIENKYQSLLNVLSMVGEQELMAALSSYVMSFNDPETLKNGCEVPNLTQLV